MDNQDCLPEDRIWSLLSKKMANEANPEELAELDELLKKNIQIQHQVELLTQMWLQDPGINLTECEAAFLRHLVNHKDEFFIEESAEEIDSFKKEEAENEIPVWRGMARKNILVWSTTIIVAGIALFFLFQKKGDSQTGKEAISSITTKNGNRTKIVLPDGSQVWLNAGSSLDYNNQVFNKVLREVRLNGEAYFDVAKNAEKPFIIHTEKMDIKVLGTVFNVRSYSNEKIAEASLIRGSIEVTLKDRKDNKIILKPNEKISIASQEIDHTVVVKNKTATRTTTTSDILPQIVVKELQPNPVNNIIAEIAWTQNKLFFEDESLENVALMLERWFGKKVLIQKDRLKKIRYTGNFEKEKLEDILIALQLSAPFNFKTENDTVLIY
jgi:ferric-dicitrate binding protein FerR (iron transport regulator)